MAELQNEGHIAAGDKIKSRGTTMQGTSDGFRSSFRRLPMDSCEVARLGALPCLRAPANKSRGEVWPCNAQPNKLTQLFDTHRRYENTASQHYHRRKGKRAHRARPTHSQILHFIYVAMLVLRIKQEADSRIGPSIFGSMMLTYPYPRYARSNLPTRHHRDDSRHELPARQQQLRQRQLRG